MPGTLARLVALAVTTIIVFGSDGDVLRAAPLGLFAGVLSMIFVTAADALQPALARPRRRRASF